MIVTSKQHKGKENCKSFVQGIIEKHHNQLISYAFFLTKNKEAAKDLVQELYIKIMRKCIVVMKGYYSKKQVAYLITMLKRMHITQIRKNKKRPPFVDDYDFNQPYDSESEIEESIFLKNRCQECINRLKEILSADEFQLWLLREVEGYSYKELSEELNISGSNVGVKLKRIRKKINDNKHRF